MRSRLVFSLSIGKFAPTIVVLAVAAGFVLLVLSAHQWDPMAFVRLGTRYSQGDPDGEPLATTGNLSTRSPCTP